MARACQEVQDNVPPMVKRLRDFIATLTERQQEFYRLVYIEEYTKAEAAKIMGITPQRATTIDHQIRELQRELKRTDLGEGERAALLKQITDMIRAKK